MSQENYDVTTGSGTEDDSDVDMVLEATYPSKDIEVNFDSGTPLVEEVEQAISTISNYSVVQAKDSATHPAIEESVDVLIRFLERATLKFVPARSSVTPTESIIFQLLQTFFLQHLFELRAEFHDLAISENASSSVVFCWVDLVLGYLSEAVLELLSSSPPLLSAEANATLNVQQKNTRLRAIAQLPRLWNDIPSFLTSSTSSPLSLRLLLSLVYGSLVLRNRFLGDTFEFADMEHRQQLHKSAQQVVIRVYEVACGVTMDVFATGHLYQRKAAGISAPDLIQTSLALAVFVELDYLCAENSLEIEGPRIRPYTLHAILSLIELMNNHPDHADPSYVDAITGDLDVTQKILHSFSSVIPWTWSACHKMGSEPNNVILSATLVWLHCSQIPSKQDRTNVFTLCSETARKDLLINPLACQGILGRLLELPILNMKHEHQRSVSIGASMKLVLLRISWCHLVMLHAGVSNKGHTVDVCRKFLSMMMILGITGLDLQLREAIVEYLFGVDPDSFAAASDNDGSYVRAALSWIHMTIEQNQSDDAVCEDVPLSLKTVMQTLTLLLQRGSKILQDPRPRPDLIQTLMSFAARWSHVPSLYQAILGDLCVMAASFYPGLPGDVRSIETDKVERIILVVGALAQRDCFLDAALANMIATQVEHCRTDALLRYEMMDTLCDALMVVLCHTTGDYRLWSCGLAICRALKPLVVNFQHESQVFGSFRIGKMLSLIDERSHNGDHDTDASLRGFRLACGVIAKMITGDYKKEASPQEPRADEPATDKYPTRLVLTSVDGVSRMIHVPSSLL